MPAPGNDWTATNLTTFDLKGEPLARAFGWTFWEHPKLGDEHPVLAVSLAFGLYQKTAQGWQFHPDMRDSVFQMISETTEIVRGERSSYSREIIAGARSRGNPAVFNFGPLVGRSRKN